MSEIDENPYEQLYESFRAIKSKSGEMTWRFDEMGTASADDDEVKQAIDELKALVWQLDSQHDYAKREVAKSYERMHEEWREGRDE
jgi:hypothetical protein